MKQRINAIFKGLSILWRSLIKWITPVFCVGAIMIIMSVILLVSQSKILQASGTAILAAGLTIITTTLTGRESLRQQFAKEVNTLRKDTIYGPLSIEVKQISESLDKAKKKERPYPFCIFGTGEKPAIPKYRFVDKYPTFGAWSQFREDYRLDSFKSDTCIALDEIQNYIVVYNQAMPTTMSRAEDVLAPYIKKRYQSGKSRRNLSNGGKSGIKEILKPYGKRMRRYIKNREKRYHGLR